VRWNPAEHYYVLAGLADANGNPRDLMDSFDGFFNDGEYFKHIEAGWYGSWESRFEDNIHLTYWHADECTEAVVPDGWGVQFSFSRKLGERWLPFLRIGYADGGGFLDLTATLAERYDEYQSNPSSKTQRAFVRTVDLGQHLMDLSAVAPTARREIAADTLRQLWELIARVELPLEDDIPDTAAFASGGELAEQPPKWRLPGAGIVIQRVEEGARAREFLISPETVASA